MKIVLIKNLENCMDVKWLAAQQILKKKEEKCGEKDLQSLEYILNFFSQSNEVLVSRK